MPLIFWLDVAAYALSALIGFTLVLVVLGAGLTRRVNQLFALFALAEMGWALLALLLRLSLWLGIGNHQLLLELSTICFALIAPSLICFTVRYLGLPTRWADRVALLELTLLLAFTVPILRHQVVFDPYLSAVGTTSHHFTPLGLALAALFSLSLLWPSLLFWRERHRTGERYLAWSLFALLFGVVVGGVLNPPVPIMSFITTISVGLLGYAVINRQVLNPLRELTTQLEWKVAERTRELAERTAQLEALREVGLELIAELELDALLHTIVSRAAELLAVDAAGIFLRKPGEDVLEWVVATGGYGPPIGSTIRRGEGLAGRVWERGEPLIINNYRRWKGRIVAYDELEIGAALGVPIRWGETFFGVLSVGVRVGSPRAFSPADAELLSLFAIQAAVALENARLYQELQRRAEELEERVTERTRDLERRTVQLRVAATVARDATTAESLEELLERAVYLVRDRFGFYHAGIFLLDGRGEYAVLRAATGEPGRKMLEKGHKLKVGKVGIVGYVAGTGKPRIALDVGTDAVHFKNPLLPYTRSEMALPLKVGDRIIGVLDVQSTEEAAFDEEDVAVLQTMADQLAVAIERLERTAEIRAEHARLEAILRSTTDGIIVANRRGEILHANPVVQRWLTRTLTPQEAEQLWETVRRLAAHAEERPQAVLELKGLDLELSAAPVIGEELKDRAVVISVHDVTHLKALDRMKSRFITNISHELRTPVTTIKLYAYLMQKQPDRWQEYIGPLSEEAERQAALIEDILQISRIDAGRLELNPVPTELNELTQAAVESYRAQAEEKGLKLIHLPAEPGPVALVDPWQLEQVLDRLLKNAVLYTLAEGQVEVTTGQEEAEGRMWATVRISDTGMGIPEEELPHIFDRFFRGVEPRRMQISGTGLGLAIVKEIVELHGGRVTVESQVGKGSTFTVWLPLAEG